MSKTQEQIIDEAVKKWIGQGHSDEWAVINFMTGAGLNMVKDLLSAGRQSLVKSIEKKKGNPWTYMGELYKEGYENALSDIIALIKGNLLTR